MAPPERLDVAVIGAGVIGLAVARALALSGREVVVLEAEDGIGRHTSSRNSEVIHAGIYYSPGSQKARLCVAGKRALYDYCKSENIAHARCGKIIVATRDEEISVLEKLKSQAEANGVHDLVWLSAAEVGSLEPAVTCVRGLLSPSTGIVDSHEFMNALRRDAVGAGASVLLSSPVSAGRVRDRGVELEIGGADPVNVVCQSVVNAAGLFAPDVARRLVGLSEALVPGQFFAKGHYFVMSGQSPFSHLVYPVPQPGGLGVHVTLDLAGRARFGPDVSWVDDVDYAFDAGRAAAFYGAIRRYFPALADGSLDPGYTGIRPKLGPASSPVSDFVIQGPRDHGVPGLVNLYGIESPGLTAALAIADEVKNLLVN
jgi:L-2-hydroxyglutarate oxidase LhgO